MLLSELLAGLIAKLAGMGLAAKAALGLGAATAALTSAGVAGVLPEPAQHAVASVVNAVSPLQLPDPDVSLDVDATTDPSLPQPLLPGADDQAEDDGDDGTDDATGERKDNHGACVSAVAKDKTFVGRDHGLAVSTAAKSDCGKETTTSSSSTTTSTTTTTALGPSSAAELDDGGNRGKGRGEGNSGSSANRGASQNRGQGNGGSSGKGGS